MAILRRLLLLFIVLSMGNAEVNLVEKCPYGWSNFGIRCYKFFPQLVNWITAERNCQSLGSNLASVHSNLENSFVLHLVPSSTRAWIGGHDGVQEGQWVWSDGTPYDYTSWCSGEPTNLNYDNGLVENCGEINWTSNHCWNDAQCSTLLAYVCSQDM